MRHVVEKLGSDLCDVILQDSYYRDCPEAFEDNLKFNFDHPDSIDFDELADDLARLKSGTTVHPPVTTSCITPGLPVSAAPFDPARWCSSTEF